MHRRTKRKAVNKHTFGPSSVYLGVAEKALEGGEVSRGGLHPHGDPSRRLGKLRGWSRLAETPGSEPSAGLRQALERNLAVIWSTFLIFMRKLRANEVKWLLKSQKKIFSEAYRESGFLGPHWVLSKACCWHHRFLFKPPVSMQRDFIHTTHLGKPCGKDLVWLMSQSPPLFSSLFV